VQGDSVSRQRNQPLYHIAGIELHVPSWEPFMPMKRNARTKGRARKYSEGADRTVASALRRRKKGTLRSGPGGKGGRVTSRKQAIAIGLSEARSKGMKVPARWPGTRSRSTARKK
jgi:hypothetical protein